jgi:hypothetical protein
LSRPTAYRLVSDPTYVPAGEVLDKICSAYQVQPGELLVWKAGDGTDEGSSVEQDRQVQINQSRETIDDKSLPSVSMLVPFSLLFLKFWSQPKLILFRFWCFFFQASPVSDAIRHQRKIYRKLRKQCDRAIVT